MPSHHLSAALTQLTPEQQTEYVIAFNKIDTSGDELLQKSEISQALVETGEHVSVSELEKMLAGACLRHACPRTPFVPILSRRPRRPNLPPPAPSDVPRRAQTSGTAPSTTRTGKRSAE